MAAVGDWQLRRKAASLWCGRSPRFGSLAAWPWRGLLAACWLLAVPLHAAPAVAPPSGPAPAAPAAEFDWLKLRRLGADAMLDSTRKRLATRPWQQTYRAQVPPGDKLAGTDITVARGGQGAPQVSVRVSAGPEPIRGTGLVVMGAKGWLRTAGEKAAPLPQEALFRQMPLLDLPWAAFCVVEWLGHYSPKVEGEFGDVGVLRLTPDYMLGVTARLAKASIHKNTGNLVAVGLTDGKGQKVGEVVWAGHDANGVPTDLHIRGPGDNAPLVHFRAVGKVQTPAKTAFGASALK